jgi:hypothetical protein
MAAVLRLLFLVPLAFILACVAAACVLVAGMMQGVTPRPVQGEFVMMVIAASMGIGTLAAVPAFFAILAAETFRWRSLFYWLAIGALIALLAATTPAGITMIQAVTAFVVLIMTVPHYATYDGSGANFPVIALAAGFAGGFVYWLIAGRTASAGMGERELDRERTEHARE